MHIAVYKYVSGIVSASYPVNRYMLQYLHSLHNLLQPGVQLQRSEVIRRYRAMKGHSKEVLRMLCMTQFFMIAKNEKGEISLL